MSSVGPLGGIPASAAGAPLSQTKGSDVERNAQDIAARDRQIDSAKKAESAAGIGETEQQQESSDRDADGRRLWEDMSDQSDDDNAEADEQSESDPVKPHPQAKDAHGKSGNRLDLTG